MDTNIINVKVQKKLNTEFKQQLDPPLAPVLSRKKKSKNNQFYSYDKRETKEDFSPQQNPYKPI